MTTLFACVKCNVIDSLELIKPRLSPADPLLCSLCDPRTACWHGVFARVQYKPGDVVVNRPNVASFS